VKVRVYTLVEHANFAPHVSGGIFSLANCASLIRRYVGDHPKECHWIGGLTPARMGRPRLAYLAHIDRVVERHEYAEEYGLYDDSARRGRWDAIYADNLADPVSNPWHDPASSDKRMKNAIKIDQKCGKVLLSTRFFFFSDTYGSKETNPHGLDLDDPFDALLKRGARGYGASVEIEDDFLPWIEKKWIEKQSKPAELSTIYKSARLGGENPGRDQICATQLPCGQAHTRPDQKRK
jgi:hypothetical protein